MLVTRHHAGATALIASLMAYRALAAPDGGVEPAAMPPTLLEDSPAAYPPEPERAGLGGEVVLKLTVDEAGEVCQAEVQSSPDDAFSREALRAAMGLRFEPAAVAGVPRAVQLEFTYRFEVPRPPPPAEPTAVLTGVVRARGTRQPIPFARLVSDDQAAESDEHGRFRLELKAGMRWIQVSAPGFFTGAFREALSSTRALAVVYGLTPKQVKPFETVVRAEPERSEGQRVELRDAEIREVPGTLGDPFRVVMLLPGVSSVLSGVAYPVVRGSSPAATGYFLDGVRVPQLFHVFLGPAVVHPDFIEGLDFYAGGAPVKYGRLLGGVIEGRLARPPEEFHATAYADLLNAGLFIAAPIEKTDTHVSLAGRLSYTAGLIGLVSPLLSGSNGARLVADFWDYQARVDQGLLGGHAQLFAFGSNDVFGTTHDDPTRDSSVQAITFHRIDAKYRHPLGPGEVLGELTLGDDLFGFNLRRPANAPAFPDGPDVLVGQQRQDTRIEQQTWTGKVSWQGGGENWQVSSGATWDHLRAGYTQTLTFSPLMGESAATSSEAPVASANFFGAWADATFIGLKRLSVTAGARLDHYHLVPSLSATSADPRVTAKYEVSERLALRAQVGEFHQPPTFLISLPVVDVSSVRYGLQDVVQTSLGATWRAWRELELSADAYWNPMLRTVELGVFDDERAALDTPVDRNGNALAPAAPSSRPGVAYGLDLMLRWPMNRRWFGWVTLSLQRSTRNTAYAVYDANGRRVGTNVAELPYAFDQSVVSNAVMSYRFDNGLSLGATAHFNTGRPESGQFGSRTQRAGVGESGGPAWVRVSRDAVDRLPPFFRVDVRVSKTWVLDTFTLEAWLDVLNVTVSGEVVGFDYQTDSSGNLVKLPSALPIIIPNLGLKGRY